MARQELVGNAPATTLAGAINNSVTSIVITSGTNWPTGATAPFVATIDRGLATEEKILVTTRTGTTLNTVTRGYDGTTAQAHANLAVIEHTISAVLLDEVNRVANERQGNTSLASGTTVASASKVAAEGTARYSRDASGKMSWGPGSGAADVQLQRLQADILELQDELRLLRGSAANQVVSSRVSGDSQDRMNILADGKNQWGSGAAGVDTNLYRASADKLKTDDAFEVGAAFTALSTAAVTGVLTADNLKRGSGSPEGAITGNVGDVFLRTNGSSGATLYVKESGNATNTGWVAHGRASLVGHNESDESTTTRGSDQTLGSVTVPAGLMAVGDALRARFECTFVNTGGSNETFVPKLKIGATTVLASGSNYGNCSGSQSFTCDIEFMIHLVSLTSLRCWGRIMGNRQAGAPAAGLITNTAYGTGSDNFGTGHDTTSAENFANSTAVALIVNMSNNGTATSTFTIKNRVLERLAA